MAKRKAPKGTPIEGWALTGSERQKAEDAAANGHRGSKIALLNDKYAHLGLSVPRPLPMSHQHNTVERITRNDGTVVNANTLNQLGKKGWSGLSRYFIHPETGKPTPEIHDVEGLHADPEFQVLVHRHLEQVKANVAAGHTEKALGFYPKENAKLEEIGKSFNRTRAEQGLPEYFPEDHNLAGALISSAYSKGNSEANRNRMVKTVAETGELPDWNGADKDINRATANNLHPLDVWKAKLRDFAGSMLHPHSWEGTHNGVKLGSGYTVDRHVNNVSVGRQFGDLIDPQLSGGAPGGINDRRYRVQQEALRVAHKAYDPEGKMSPSAFQSLAWPGHSSAAHYQAPE